MKPYFDLYLVHKNRKGETETTVFNCGTEKLPVDMRSYPLKNLIERVFEMAREAEFEPLRLIYVPYIHIAVYNSSIESYDATFIADVYSTKCIWAAEGQSLDDVNYEYYTPYELGYIKADEGYYKSGQSEIYIKDMSEF